MKWGELRWPQTKELDRSKVATILDGELFYQSVMNELEKVVRELKK
ncbi:MAG: hypothetical protein WD688_25990 [Candidatus Binatia bacterium]